MYICVLYGIKICLTIVPYRDIYPPGYIHCPPTQTHIHI